jgi:hypothetical protein
VNEDDTKRLHQQGETLLLSLPLQSVVHYTRVYRREEINKENNN